MSSYYFLMEIQITAKGMAKYKNKIGPKLFCGIGTEFITTPV